MRTREEIDKDYQLEALNVGHKVRMFRQHQEQAEALEKDIDVHYKKMVTLTAEAQALPPLAPTLAKAPDAVPMPEAPSMPAHAPSPGDHL